MWKLKDVPALVMVKRTTWRCNNILENRFFAVLDIRVS